MSENTVPYGDFVRLLFNRSGDLSKDFTHAILGIVTEIHEYLSATDAVNGLEELGDLEFYVEALSQVVADAAGGHTLFPSMVIPDDSGSMEDIAGAISHECNELLDHAKRWVGYNKRPADLPLILEQAAHLVAFVNRTGPFPCTDADRIQASNMAKLNTRYQGKYSQAAALNRNLEAERATLASS